MPVPPRILRCAFALVFVTACATTPDPQPTRREAGVLTNAAIFADKAYEAREPGATQWLTAANMYTAVEPAAGSEDATPGVDANGDDVPLPQDIVAYDLDTLERSVLVSSQQLTPTGANSPLAIDDYSWSDDRHRLLIYTNSKQVWRAKSRGDYWLLDIETGEPRTARAWRTFATRIFTSSRLLATLRS